MKKPVNQIIISRADSIGDVILTLPLAGAIKRYLPHAKIIFLGKRYTQAVIECCEHVDEFLDEETFLSGSAFADRELPDCIIHVFPKQDLAKAAKEYGIANRIGTTNRFYHWASCNNLVFLSRKNSEEHEAMLNLALLKGLGIQHNIQLDEIPTLYGLTKLSGLPIEMQQLLRADKFNVILHPKSQGSGREWPLQRYAQLVDLLNDDFNIFVSGTEKERALLSPLFEQVGDRVIDITGTMSLAQFIRFISMSDALVASGTGPVHIASALGIDALGMYPPIRPMHPQRWAPIGKNSHVFVVDRNCSDCRNEPAACHCMEEVEAASVAALLQQKKKEKKSLHNKEHLKTEN